MPSWTNSDGLTIYFGQDEAAKTQGGEYKIEGLFRIEDIEVNLSELGTTSALLPRYRGIFPWGKVLARVEIIADVPAAGGTSVSFGFRNNKTGVAISTTGAVNAIPTASLTPEGATTILNAGSTYAGALVGQVVSNVQNDIGVTGFTAGTFTAGRVRLRLYWYKKTSTT